MAQRTMKRSMIGITRGDGDQLKHDLEGDHQRGEQKERKLQANVIMDRSEWKEIEEAYLPRWIETG